MHCAKATIEPSPIQKPASEHLDADKKPQRVINRPIDGNKAIQANNMQRALRGDSLQLRTLSEENDPNRLKRSVDSEGDSEAGSGSQWQFK